MPGLSKAAELLLENPRRVMSALKNPSESYAQYREIVVKEQNRAKYRELEKFTQDGLYLNYSFADTKEAISDVTDAELEAVVARSHSVLQEYLSDNREPLDKLLADREYVLVSGSPRTGGAYTTQKLRQTLCDYREGDGVVGNEGIPSFKHFHNISNRENYKQGLFEFIQWVVWIDEYYSDHDYIVKKCSGFLSNIEFVDEFFHDTSIHILVTTRHPAAIHASDVEAGPGVVPASLVLDGVDKRRDLAGIGGPGNTGDLPEWWVKLPWRMRVLYYWQQLYIDAVKSLPEHQEDQLYSVRYGEQDDKIIDLVGNIAPEKQAKIKELVEADPFYLTEREYEKFWSSGLVRAIIRDVSHHWEIEGFEFPVTHGELSR